MNKLIFYFFCLDFTLHLHCKGYMATFRLYWWRMISDALCALFQAWTGTWVEPTIIYLSWAWKLYWIHTPIRVIASALASSVCGRWRFISSPSKSALKGLQQHSLNRNVRCGFTFAWNKVFSILFNPLLHRYLFLRLLQQMTFENIVTKEEIALPLPQCFQNFPT